MSPSSGLHVLSLHDALPISDLLYIDLHMVHEVTSPQAFEGLRLAGRPVRRPDLTIGVEDHNVPTMNINEMIAERSEEHTSELQSRGHLVCRLQLEKKNTPIS